MHPYHVKLSQNGEPEGPAGQLDFYSGSLYPYLVKLTQIGEPEGFKKFLLLEILCLMITLITIFYVQYCG